MTEAAVAVNGRSSGAGHRLYHASQRPRKDWATVARSRDLVHWENTRATIIRATVRAPILFLDSRGEDQLTMQMKVFVPSEWEPVPIL
jgi:hypothetical protein